LFAVPTSQSVAVLAVAEENARSFSPTEEQQSNSSRREGDVSETAIAKLLGDWTPPPPRPCPHCGTEVLGTQTVCHECGDDLFSDNIADSIETPVIKTNQFEDVWVRRIMRPRDEVAFIDAHASLTSMQSFVRQTMHTRYPVCNQTLDKPLGVVHIKDILVVEPSTEVFDLSKIMTTLECIPERLPISGAFRHLQMTHRSIALVVSASRATTGIVTMQDLLAKMMGVSP
jgi:CBS domain-containing protein